MFHSVGRIMRWAGAYRKRMVLGFVCSFFATWCTAGPVVLAAWALGQLIVDAWGEERLSPHLPWLCLGGIVVLILLRFFFTYWKKPASGEYRHGTGGRAADGAGECAQAGVPGVLRQKRPGRHFWQPSPPN